MGAELKASGRRFRRATALVAVGVAALAVAAPRGAAAQHPEAYVDEVAATLHRAASESWRALDASVVRYTALVRQRIGATLRTPLKDRNLYRTESAARVFWDRDHETLIQALGARAHYPGRAEDLEMRGAEAILDNFTIEGAFDPGGDRLIFGMGPVDPDGLDDDDDFRIAHPLAPGADSLYRFRSGDTLIVSLPDGRELRAIRLDVLPRSADPRYIAGTLWIEPTEGALVRAAFRLARQFDAMRDVAELREQEAEGDFRFVPGFLKPWTFDMEVMVVDYAYWHFRVWLPRAARFEGVAAAGILKFPVSYDLAYDIETVVLEEDLDDLAGAAPVLEEHHFRTRAQAMAFMARLARERGVLTGADGHAVEWRADNRGRLLPRDLRRLGDSPVLPPPIHQDAVGFPSAAEIGAALDALASLPAPPITRDRWRTAWGLQRPGLARYNRVEGPAVGAEVEVTASSWVGPLTVRGVGFVGLADLDPKARLSVERASLRRILRAGAYRELRPLDEGGRHLGIGNSLQALIFGRDDGEYFRATGLDLEVAPPVTRRASWSLRFFAERQEPVVRKTDFALVHALDDGWRFRPLLPAREVDEVGAEVRIAPWWGTDPRAPQFGAEVQLRGGGGRPEEGDDYRYLRGALTLRAAVPLLDGRWRVAMEGGGGRIEGDAPLQQYWTLGGPATLRGFDATTTVGRHFLRGRLEVARQHPGWALTLFGDVGRTRDRPVWSAEGVGRWAPDREGWDHDGARWAVGLGASILDGLIRLDLSRGIAGPDRRTRLDLHLDAVF